MLQITLDKEVTFQLPEGEYKAQLTGLKPFTKQSGKGRQNWIKLHFQVQIPDKENFDCRAGRSFQLNLKAGSDLRNFLLPILGQDFFSKNSAKGIDLEKLLVGKEGVVKLSHFFGPEYDEPLVVVDEFRGVEEGGKD
jgi:hypothetical protein